jgi:hypothetical protein
VLLKHSESTMFRSLSTLSAALVLTGCASIFNGQTQAIVFQSTPTEAAITVTNRAGEQVHSGTTPATVTLKRGAGYFKSESYTVKFVKQGFKPKEMVVTSTMSGWYLGNILFGGLIGMVAVDPLTGGMYVFPSTVSAPLEAASSPSASRSGELKLVSFNSLTPEMQAKAKLVGNVN